MNRTIIPLLALFLMLSVHAQAQPAGAGTEADPYRIATFDDLHWISTNSSAWSAHIIQTADIDAGETQITAWVPIGHFGVDVSTATPFTGSYDGQNFVIDGLHMEYNQSIYEVYWGLFAIIGELGRVSNLGIVNLDYTEKAGLRSFFHGGLAALNYGTISNCYTTGSIAAPDSTYGGGLVGENHGAISRSYSTCTVVSGNTAGGLTATNSGSIDNSFATGSVSGHVSGSTWRGGLLGFNHASGIISNCYSTGTVTGDGGALGGFSAFNDGAITNCFWNTETSGMATSTGGTGLTTAQMQTRILFSYAGWDFDEETANGTDDIWGMNLTDNGGYPFLSIQGYTSYAQTPAGSGSAEDPYLIASLQNLYWLSHCTEGWGSHFKQTVDLDAASTATWSNGAGVSPVGSTVVNFTGSYDGQGFKISGLTINHPAKDHVGLFGYTAGSVTISNLRLETPTIKGNANVGAFVGTGAAVALENCAVINGSVTGGGTNVGGLVGGCSGTLSIADTTASHGSVTGSGDHVGGLVGICSSTLSITASSASGVSVRGGGAYVGGLVGVCNGGVTMSDVSATDATVAACSNHVGGLVGYCEGPLSMTGSHTTGSINQAPSSVLSHAGGLVGGVGVGGETTLSNCSSTVTIDGNNTVGGLIGEMPSGSITDSHHSTGTIACPFNYGGGLVGKTDTIVVSRSYSSGDIAGSSYSYWYKGGLVGCAENADISHSYSSGTISGLNRRVGGLVGQINVEGPQPSHIEASSCIRGRPWAPF